MKTHPTVHHHHFKKILNKNTLPGVISAYNDDYADTGVNSGYSCLLQIIYSLKGSSFDECFRFTINKQNLILNFAPEDYTGNMYDVPEHYEGEI